MRGLKSFALLLVVALGLGAYLYFVESKKTPGDEATKKDKVFDVEADTIDEITIASESGDRTTLRKNGADWQIVQPLAAQPDAAEVSGLTSNLSSVEVQRVIDENPPDLKEFGLAAPRVQVTFKAGGKSQTLQIGQKTPTGTDLYAKLADQKKIFLISSFLDSTFNRTTFDLRDKTVLKLDATKVDALEADLGSRTLKFGKKDGEWEIEQPLATRADFGAVEALVEKISSARMKSIAAAEPADLEPYGLDTPVATVRIGIGSSQAALALGASSGEGAIYAKDLSRPSVFTIESTLLDDVRKDVGDYRQKDLFDARAFTATRIDVTRSGKAVAFEKTTVKGKDGKDEERWKQVLPAARDVESAQVEALLTAATLVRAMGFVASTAKTNIEKPELTVVVKFDKDREDRVSFSRSGANGYAQRPGTPGVATVETAAIEGIIKALDDIK